MSARALPCSSSVMAKVSCVINRLAAPPGKSTSGYEMPFSPWLSPRERLKASHHVSFRHQTQARRPRGPAPHGLFYAGALLRAVDAIGIIPTVPSPRKAAMSTGHLTTHLATKLPTLRRVPMDTRPSASARARSSCGDASRWQCWQPAHGIRHVALTGPVGGVCMPWSHGPMPPPSTSIETAC